MTTRIAPTTIATAPEATRPILQQLQQGIGFVPNLFATIGQSPGALASLLAWDTAVGKGGLSKREIELLNLHVSELNGCGYCISAHAAIGKGHRLTEVDIANARIGIGTTERESALLALARRIVRTGGSGAGTELVRAREAGVKDAEVVDVLAIVALKAFTNAVAIVAQTEIDFPRAPGLPST